MLFIRQAYRMWSEQSNNGSHVWKARNAAVVQSVTTEISSDPTEHWNAGVPGELLVSIYVEILEKLDLILNADIGQMNWTVTARTRKQKAKDSFSHICCEGVR